MNVCVPKKMTNMANARCQPRHRERTMGNVKARTWQSMMVRIRESGAVAGSEEAESTACALLVMSVGNICDPIPVKPTRTNVKARIFAKNIELLFNPSCSGYISLIPSTGKLITYDIETVATQLPPIECRKSRPGRQIEHFRHLSKGCTLASEEIRVYR